ncbi:MAG: hypothetical protein ACXACO_04560 [Promethearchaeota archaeon]
MALDILIRVDLVDIGNKAPQFLQIRVSISLFVVPQLLHIIIA